MKEWNIKITDTEVYINGELHQFALPMDKEDPVTDMDKKALLALAGEMGYEAIFLFEEMAARLDEMLDEVDEEVNIMKNIQIKDSYNIWNAIKMRELIREKCYEQYGSYLPEEELNRSYSSMYIEWWLHNIGYYITKSLCSNKFFNKLNLRCKDVDINEHVRY